MHIQHKFRAEVCEITVKYNISTVLNADQTGERCLAIDHVRFSSCPSFRR
ncbi:hypothetical protein PHPALM_31318 [Phytophthora palmivora]|uniref:Uncharacterized protein n=1 Tax=Phytophthora palmivora TaxID=4796 RepID=A0A2P4X2V7_9STRA|nr:hypothetical protein PHPALM_31318 [Phytophthora palmivora]